jgi:murein tripeptide amidase MpaA
MNYFGRLNKKYLLFWIIVISTLVLAGIAVLAFFLVNERKVSLPPLSITTLVDAPTKIEQKIFGYSANGSPIEGYEIGDGPNVVLLIGAMHGNELGSAYLLDKLITEIKADPRLVSKSKKLIIIPVTNPDGYSVADKFNGNGVNLNLNFDTPGWAKYGPQGTYAGEKPFSEPESKTIKKIVEQYKPMMMISYHTAGGIVSPENDALSATLGRWYASKTGYLYFDDAMAAAESVDWDFSGTATMWFVENMAKPAITVELTNHNSGDWSINKGALIELIFSSGVPVD